MSERVISGDEVERYQRTSMTRVAPMFGALTAQEVSYPLVQFIALDDAIKADLPDRAQDLVVGAAAIHGHTIPSDRVMNLWEQIPGAYRTGLNQEPVVDCAPVVLFMESASKWIWSDAIGDHIASNLHSAIDDQGRMPLIGGSLHGCGPVDFFAMLYRMKLKSPVIVLPELHACMRLIGSEKESVWSRPEVHKALKAQFILAMEERLAGQIFSANMEAPMRFLHEALRCGALEGHRSGLLHDDGEGMLAAHQFQPGGPTLLQTLCTVHDSRRPLAFECVRGLFTAADWSGHSLDGKQDLVNLICPAAGRSPLHAACSSFNPDLIELLLQSGASALLKSDEGRTALQEAERACHRKSINKLDQVATMLRAAEAREEAFQVLSGLSGLSRPPGPARI